jgi:hypothetical protein
VGGAELVEAQQGDGEDGNAGLLGEEADSWAEGLEGAGAAASAFREDEDGEVAVEGLAGMSEAATEALAAREREDVEKGSDEPIAGWGEQVEETVGVVAGVPEVAEHLAGHGRGDTAAELGGEGVENESAVVCVAVRVIFGAARNQTRGQRMASVKAMRRRRIGQVQGQWG